MMEPGAIVPVMMRWSVDIDPNHPFVFLEQIRLSKTDGRCSNRLRSYNLFNPEDKLMNLDTIEGTATEFGGNLKSKAGKVTGNAHTEMSGKATEMSGTVQKLYGEARDAVQGAIDSASPAVRDSAEQLIDFSKRKPLISLAAASIVGYAVYNALQSR